MGLNILTVDDSATVRSIIRKTLDLAGVPVGEFHQAGNGREALEILGAHWIDLVFADLNMPEMGGVELVERMSQDELMRKIPVIVVSTDGSETRLEQLKARGVKTFVRKPFTPEQLSKAVRELTGVNP